MQVNASAPINHQVPVHLVAHYGEHPFQVWFNNKGYVSMIGYMNIMNNLILRSNLRGGENPDRYGISLISHPLNRTHAQLEDYLLYVN